MKSAPSTDRNETPAFHITHPTAAEVADALDAGILVADTAAWLPPVPETGGVQEPGFWGWEG